MRLFFLFRSCGTLIDPTLSSRCDTIGTSHNWTKLSFLRLINGNLPILFIKIQHFNCPWTITSNNDSLAVNITYLKWTFRYEFWTRMEIQAQGNATTSQLQNLYEHHPLFKSPATAILNYQEVLEPHLNEFQLHAYGESMDHLSYKVD